MLDDRFDEFLEEAARDYNPPPATPRDAMWEAIQAGRRAPNGSLRGGEADEAIGGLMSDPIASSPAAPRDDLRARRRPRLAAWITGIAALIALGVGIGRLTAPSGHRPAPGPVAPAPAPARAERDARTVAYRVAATEHLSQAEAFLTLFRASVRTGTDERLASATARQLLASNRLLLDSPAARSGSMRVLLEDLELVLAQIAQLAPGDRRQDLDLINEGLDRDGVLVRLRAAVPAGPGIPQQGAS